MNIARLSLATALVICLLPALSAKEPIPDPGPWEVLSTSAIGAQEFISAHPHWDGRGVVIAVIDTGVDPAMAGLATTPSGNPKIADLRDFSGEGDVTLERAILDSDTHGQGVRAGDGPWLRGLESLSVQPKPGRLWVAYLREQNLKGSDVEDLDGNGRTDDIFGAVVFESERHSGVERLIVVDTDGDGRVDDEKLRQDYLFDPNWFTLGAADRRDDGPTLSIVLNLWENQSDKLTFVFDDGAHGSHVAGIAAGHRIGGQNGQNGIAPGAKLISLKLGNNSLSGGASTTGSMWNAWHYAARYAAEHDLPLVIQMSFGVGGEAEGQSVIEQEIDRILASDDRLVGCTSNGNSGPGLSTAGLPSCARRTLAVGAALNRSTAAHLYGVDLPSDKLFYFSSRGAEFAKPDLIAPGVAASTVPAWREGRDVMRGTSMASPQVAGAAALILSAARAENLPIVGAWVVQALRRSARWIDSATVLDQGPGMVNIPGAWEVYKSLASRSTIEPALWEIATESPEIQGGMGPAAHWRGVQPPYPPQRQEVTAKPVFRSNVTQAQISEFYRAFDLVSTAKWVRPAQKTVYTRSGREMTFDLTYDPETLAAPGLYSARILAFDKSASRKQRQQFGPDWDLPVSVIIAHRPATGGGIETTVEGLPPADIQRTFIHVPHSGNSLEIHAHLTGDEAQRMRLYLHDPEGRGDPLFWLGGDDNPARGSHHLSARDLSPGIWELIAYADYENTAALSAEISVRLGAVVTSSRLVKLVSVEGGPPHGEITLTNRQTQTLRNQIALSITGHRIRSDLKGVGPLSLPIEIGPNVARVDFRATTSQKDWGRTTDLPLRLLDEDDNPLLNGGMSYSVLDTSVDFAPEDAGSYTLEIRPALADPDDEAPFTVTLERTYIYRKPFRVDATGPDTDPLVLYPDHEVTLELTCKSSPPALPADAAWLLEVELTDERDENSRVHLEVLAGAE